jgi:hypothetical protein
MNEMIEPTEADIGRKVIYRDLLGVRGVIEEGVISSLNDSWVFVRYDDNPQAQATHRSHLEWSPDD